MSEMLAEFEEHFAENLIARLLKNLEKKIAIANLNKKVQAPAGSLR